jgi:AraC-like DNA-binding protein
MVRGYLERSWRNMILPECAMELIVNLGDPQTLCDLEKPRHTVFRHSWISALRTEPIVIDETGYVHLVGVRLRAAGAWPFLGIPLGEFSGYVVELNAVLGGEIDELRIRLGEETSDIGRFQILEHWLEARRRSRAASTPAVIRALRLIGDSRHPARIGRIAAEIGISHKHLLREFDRCVGLRPKVFARISAFQRVIHGIGHRKKIDWAQTAAQHGYYDQAHLIREFHSCSGLTPAEYLLRRGPVLNYLEV